MSDLILSTADGGGLAIGAYPRFRYDGRGGGGPGVCGAADAEGWRAVRFDAERLLIPPLDWRSTRLFGVPLPPGLAIVIQPLLLAGRWQPASGTLQLRFEARFQFRLAGRQAAPDLIVASAMGTEAAAGQRHRACGRRLDRDGQGLLVAIARVEPTGLAWYDRFLGLPDEALAVLPCRLRSA